MKKTKKMCLIAGIIGLAAVAGVAINSANSAPKMSDLMLKNLEILTRYENGGSEGFQIQSTEGRCYVYVNGKEYQGGGKPICQAGGPMSICPDCFVN